MQSRRNTTACMNPILLPTVSSIDAMPLGPMGQSPPMPVIVMFILIILAPVFPKLLEGGIRHHVHRGGSINQHASHRRAV
jgi:hypothetical protein